MGARVADIGDLSSSAWAGKKPKNYKGADLDKALKAWESLAAKPVTFPPALIPAAPAFKLSEIEGCAVLLKAAITEVEKLKKAVSERVTALKAVATAGAKASADLMKLSKGKKLNDDEVKEYRGAAIEAESLGRSADFFCKRDFE
jgi:hypothetical protein